MSTYERFLYLDIDSSFIGLIKSDNAVEYFCTPIGAKVIGWEGCDGIHYCFIEGLGDAVFAVNPSSCADIFVYPLANNFEDFIRLILALKSTAAMEQIILWEKEQLEEFLLSSDNEVHPEQEEVLTKIKNELELDAMEQPFEYVKSVQANFDYESIAFTDEYYDLLGIDRQ